MPTDENSSIILKAGIEKKSFELYYNGGSIWCEHLDGMGFFSEKVREKFLCDFKQFARPSMTSFMIINLDETELDDEIISCITDTLVRSEKRIMKLAFVGVKKSARGAFRRIGNEKKCAVNFYDDYEKAKQWTLP